MMRMMARMMSSGFMVWVWLVVLSSFNGQGCSYDGSEMGEVGALFQIL
jgi:hypothetical protein